MEGVGAGRGRPRAADAPVLGCVKLNKPNSLVVASTEGKLQQFNEASVQLTCWVKERISERFPSSLLQGKRAGHSLSFCSLLIVLCCFLFKLLVALKQMHTLK